MKSKSEIANIVKESLAYVLTLTAWEEPFVVDVQLSNEEKLVITITSDEMSGVMEFVHNVLNADGANINHEETLYLTMVEKGLTAVEASSVFGWWELFENELLQNVQGESPWLDLYEGE